MSPQLRKTIQKFLTDYNNNSEYSIADFEMAINLLQKAVVEDYKIPDDSTDWQYTKPKSK